MITTARLVIFCGVVLTGCHTMKRAAVTTFNVIDTPARYVRNRIEPGTTTTTEYNTPDVVHPGRPVEGSPPAAGPSPRRSAATPGSSSTTTGTPGRVAASNPSA